ncbi:derriere [Pelobates cultripes]|uniref:Derriere, partial n=1 Tax=Pelobates cultripes TaxID=61616 RepID=A0AAD1W4J8_PELCU|nr:derriere [Pelobates cultripes]
MSRLEIKFNQNKRHRRVFDLRLYQILNASFHSVDQEETRRKLLVVQTVRLPQQPLHINLTEVCKNWRTTYENLGLDLEIVPKKESSLMPISMEQCKGFRTYASITLLTVTLNTWQCLNPQRKIKFNKMPSTFVKNCKKLSIYVDFKDLGLQNWVVAPKGYSFNYCDGNCLPQFTKVQHEVNYSTGQAMTISRRSEDVSGPCCIPVKMSPVSMLFYDNEDNIVLKQYENMSVDECDCVI